MADFKNPGKKYSSNIVPPIAEKHRKEFTEHNNLRIDDYYWLNDRNNPKVIKYLESENNYTDKMTQHTKQLQDELFKEIKGRIKETDSSVPYKYGNYEYYIRYEKNKEYPIYCRKKIKNESKEASLNIEEIILDVNDLAKGYKYFSVSGLKISPNEKILSFAVDRTGRRIYDIHFKDLITGEILTDTLRSVTDNMEWANDSKTIFYTSKDLKTLRHNKIFKHKLNWDQSSDNLIYEEKDETFNIGIGKSKSKQYLFISSFQTITTEYRYLDADNPDGQFKVFLPRERGHEYFIDHINESFYIRTNYKAKNFRLMMVKVKDEHGIKENWQEVVPYKENNFFENFELFKNFIVIEERDKGLLRFKILNLETKDVHYIKFDEPAYLLAISNNKEPDTNLFRFEYTSMTTPNSVFDYNMENKTRVLLKEQEILGGFNKHEYKTERIFVKSKDNKEIPISLVYKKSLRNYKDGNPLLLYGYGAYGHSLDATFSPARLSLLNRGVIFAIAHVRGGEELGREWYDGGRLLNKKNTFDDFISSAEHLIKNKYAAKDKLFAMGGSAGGLLMGAILNMRPELFCGVVAEVPFVDVINTMLDKSIPLTTAEYDEWGNPNNKKYYEYILSYSPYDNVKPNLYPNILVTTGFHDSQVQYWEPAKWVAKLRECKKDRNKLLFKIDMDTGHSGASGRYQSYKEIAFIYSFILDLL